MKHLLVVQGVHEGLGSPEKLHCHISRQIISSLAFLEDGKSSSFISSSTQQTTGLCRE